MRDSIDQIYESAAILVNQIILIILANTIMIKSLSIFASLLILFCFSVSCNGQDEKVNNGEVKTYYPDGSICNVSNYVNGKINGHSLSYFRNGKIQDDCTFKNGDFVGMQKWYFPNGQLNHEEYYDNNGKQQGVFKIWYSSGQLRQTGSTINGLIIGRSIQYYENGNIESIYIYNNSGKKDSTWVYYSDDKNIIRREVYKEDSLIRTLK